MGTAFVGGILAWASAAALYLAAMCLSGWAYTGHAPIHVGWFIFSAVVCGMSYGAKAFASLAKGEK